MADTKLISRPTLICILDGFGLNPNPEGNAVALANKPCIDKLLNSCPYTTLTTHGEAVGLPEGQMGNSEVGHLNIGAGREVEQWLLRISRSLAGPFLNNSKPWLGFCEKANKAPHVHVLGLCSSGGVHSNIEHLRLLIKRLSEELISSGSKSEILLHLFTDGRDVSPNAAREDIKGIIEYLKEFPNCKIATLSGRYYAMDRDKRWERIKKAYDAIVSGSGSTDKDPVAYIEESYAKGVTDEFIEPISFKNPGIGANDALLFFNFREDRMREIVRAICISEFDGFSRETPLPNHDSVLSFTEYDHTFHLPFLFAPVEIKNHIGEYISSLNAAQFRAAETEKYAHVTYFLNGGTEQPYPGEERCLVPSPRDVATYDKKPEMSAFQVTEKVVEAIKSKRFSLLVVNLANCDMVGHTGVLEAAVKAVETVDQCLAKMLAALEEVNGQGVIFADHGNAEQMINYTDGTPFTSHTLFPVPFIVFNAGKELKLAHGGALCDVAPTVLKLMGLPQPKEMTGKSLF